MTRERPELRRLRSHLLSMGGEEVVFHPDFPEYRPDVLVSQGRIYPQEQYEFYELWSSLCHFNTFFLCSITNGRARYITGYALSEDGLWRQHSWAVDNGILVETTEGRVIYYGVELSEEEIVAFASAEVVAIWREQVREVMESKD